MLIYFGADHRGFELKEYLKGVIQDQGYEIFDAGNVVRDEADDYTTYGAEVAKYIREDPETRRGVVICGSGVGVDIVANKFPNVRSVLGINPDQVFDARSHDNVNVLAIAADFTFKPDALKMLQTFLATPFSDDARYSRRLEKISEIENDVCR